MNMRHAPGSERGLTYMETVEQIQIHRFRNNSSAIKHGNRAWDFALANGLIDIRVDGDAEGRL